MSKDKLVFSPCITLYYFLVNLMFYWSDDVVFYSVILNTCQRICIYILSYLYTVTLYSKWLLQIGNFFFLFGVSLGFFFFIIVSKVTSVTSRDSPGKSVIVLSKWNTASH